MKTLEERAAALFPKSPTMQRQWIKAREVADGIRPRLLMPWSIEQLQWTEAQFCRRDTRGLWS